MPVSLQLSTKGFPLTKVIPFPLDISADSISQPVSNLSDIDLDSRKKWSAPSIREYLWKLLSLIEKHQKSSNDIISLNYAGFSVAKLLFPKNNLNPKTIDIPSNIDLNQIKNNLLQQGKFIPYTIRKGNLTADVVFHPSKILPSDIYISTPLTFSENDKGILLTFDKNGWWNPLGGHIENGETWQETLQREAQEEGGVEINNIRVFGYIKVTNLTGQAISEFPPVSQIPLTTSHITQYHKKWIPLETTNRQFFNPKNAYTVLQERTDNGQMLQIYSYLCFLINSDLM
ncbi:MAG TPA: NUDIX hydrolase [Candidatus Woesebacteria bacterium]|nr:NUDIX hydrolase [Candidatus Woesebacteria bacterium]